RVAPRAWSSPTKASIAASTAVSIPDPSSEVANAHKASHQLPVVQSTPLTELTNERQLPAVHPERASTTQSRRPSVEDCPEDPSPAKEAAAPATGGPNASTVAPIAAPDTPTKSPAAAPAPQYKFGPVPEGKHPEPCRIAGGTRQPYSDHRIPVRKIKYWEGPINPDDIVCLNAVTFNYLCGKQGLEIYHTTVTELEEEIHRGEAGAEEDA
ncbi:hypothetical protein N0V85_009857, partial [Neurospora sp. IMI 360204]